MHMNYIVDLLQDIDLSHAGEQLLTFIDTSDPYLVVAVLGVLTLLGSRMSAPFPSLRSWGLRIAAATVLLYLGYAYFTNGPFTAEEWPRVLLRGVNAAGFVLAPLWIVFPVLLFVYTRLRLALAAFLAYVAYAWVSGEPLDAENFSRVLIQASIASGLTLIVAWILQPITDFIAKHFLPAPKQQTAQQQVAPQPIAPQPSHALVPVPQPQAPAAPSPTADHSANLRAEAAEILQARKMQLHNASEQQADDKRRRQKARFKAELSYTLHEKTLGKLFPRKMFEEFLNRYLGDHLEPAVVEENAVELDSILLQHVQDIPIVQEQQPPDLNHLTQWFVDEQQRIETHEGDQTQKKTKLVGLTRRYTQLAAQIIEEEVPS